ncbi:cyclin-D-binding Myb-like transcription factor 1 [Mytilus galloprovincialis]|uniref:cyclin-D-binding Myb-like transcription factor 1 n=1 Tax=Mytilus galloprovincialis TaxID=29158 RepID=UPI003F7CB106
MERRKPSRGKPLFVDEETDQLIHPYNNALSKKQEYWEAMGIYYRYGKWTYKEKEKLYKNWNSYLEKYESAFKNPLDLLDRRRNKDLITLMKLTDFFKVIARSLNRTTDSCYCKLRRDVHSITLKNGIFSEVEMKKLKKLSKKYKNKSCKYQLIADKLGRDRMSVKNKLYRQIKTVKRGNWTLEEEEDLIKAVREVTGLQNMNEIKQLEIPWRKVAQLVPTRQGYQCRKHFFLTKCLKLDENASKLKTWGKEESHRLIDILSNGDYSFETDIDWNEVNQSFVDFSPSASYIQLQFYKLKSGIPDFHRKSFSDLLEEINSSHKH